MRLPQLTYGTAERVGEGFEGRAGIGGPVTPLNQKRKGARKPDTDAFEYSD